MILVINVFVHIFTNVWGYVQPISPWFRNKFWLPYAILAGLLAVLSIGKPAGDTGRTPKPDPGQLWSWVGLLVILFGTTVAGVLLTTRIGDIPRPETSIIVMTYNIQQANDANGERSFDEQLAVIREVSPDILALQESDSTRISLNNNDFVRYFAGKMGYYSYFGPTTTTGTYGTAILSKFPLVHTRTIFTYSEQDEIGSAVAEVEINGETFTIFNVHPAGSDTVMLVFAETLLDQAKGKSKVIALGDYNLRDYDEAYQLIDRELINAWVSTYPSEIDPEGVDMSGENRIDHIFVSSDLSVRDPVYVLPPDSATDHPVHWAEIVWEE
jgi:endonuclease/exonuclease/phosphatase family metal-dependent hydrolase